MQMEEACAKGKIMGDEGNGLRYSDMRQLRPRESDKDNAGAGEAGGPTLVISKRTGFVESDPR